jgi:hypothetical protein
VNLEYIDEGSTQCISKLSEEEFDKNFNQYALRLEMIEKESMEYLKNKQLKLIPNLRMGWIEQIREDFNQISNTATLQNQVKFSPTKGGNSTRAPNDRENLTF